MLDIIKSAIPGPVKKELYSVKQKTYDQWYKKRLFKRMQVKHAELIEQVKGKQKIRVVFLAIHESVWKVDPVFKKMLEDPFFEPEILICPYTVYGEERMLEDMQQAYNYFISKGYPVQKSRKADGSWITLDELKPDIVFFTNPHNLTRKEYYEDAYLNYLSCYVPYSHDVSRYNNYISQYNQIFHNAMWKIFIPHDEDYRIFKNNSITKAHNTFITGYPSCEALFYLEDIDNPWKNIHKKTKKVIWAPHHTIDSPELPYSNFLELSAEFKNLAIELENDVQFAFKPHPLLKSKLYNHPDWGVQKTDSYYEFWRSSDNTQLELGDYTGLFIHSDAMIHDSGSFLAEYLYLQKPVLYLCNENTEVYLNNFGIKAKESCLQGESISDIRCFIEQLINDTLSIDNTFFNEEVTLHFNEASPSQKIVSHISLALMRY